MKSKHILFLMVLLCSNVIFSQKPTDANLIGDEKIRKPEITFRL